MKPSEGGESSIKDIQYAANGAVTYLLEHLDIRVAERDWARGVIEDAIYSALWYVVDIERSKRLTVKPSNN